MSLESTGVERPASSSLLMLKPPRSALFTPLDRLAFATRGKFTHDQAISYLPEVADIAIPKELSLKVLKQRVLPKLYQQTLKSFPGFTALPSGVQVAILSLTYNRGTRAAGAALTDDMFDKRWEMRELSAAILCKDLVWIYWYFESMRRVWARRGNRSEAGIIKRRDAELRLILPYVWSDLEHEATLQRFSRWR